MAELSELASAGLVADNSTGGGFGFSGAFEQLIEGLNAALDEISPAGATSFYFPPVISRAVLEKCGYDRNFPHLLGTVETSSSRAALADRRGPESALALTPAACFHVYPLLSSEQLASGEGQALDVRSCCFRNEECVDVDRLRAFRMREFVFIGSASQTDEFRKRYVGLVGEFLQRLGLEAELVLANDPFFGRAARLLAETQQEKALKHELMCTLRSGGPKTAVASFNAHEEKFAQTFDLRLEDGSFASSCCVAFGLERLAIGLLTQHGMAPIAWPTAVRTALRLHRRAKSGRSRRPGSRRRG